MVRRAGPWTHRDVSANGIRLHIAEMLPPRPGFTFLSTPPLVLLVHGFAGMWWTMRHLLEPLAAAGFHAVALDLRGHGDSDKPPRGYDPHTLAVDVTNLIRALGHAEALMVGHGVGGYVCWTAAYRRPRSVRGLVTLASPHPLAMREQSLRPGPQAAALLPALAYDQLPRLAERRLCAHNAAYIAEIMAARAGTAWRGTADYAESVRILRQAIQIPKVAHLTLEVRRWMVRSQFRPDGAAYRHSISPTLDHDVLALGGSEDPLVLPRTLAESSRYAPKLRLDSLRGVGHYAPMEAPAAVAERIIDFAATLPR